MTPEPDASPPARVGILDDHALIVDGLAGWIDEHATDLRVVIRTTRWLDLVRHPEFPVDVVLMDLQLGESISIESRIRACRAAGAAVVVVTALDDDSSRERSLGAGAAAFVSKTLPVSDLVAVARRVAAGERMARIGAAASAGHEASDDVAAPPDAGLSDAERRALVLYAQGLSTAEVARRMSVGYETAKTYLRRARDKYAKVGRPAGRRAELIRRVAEDGMLE
ncbi:DNA-binding NarL/FixJ family response regulator [Agromyces flavus]|uniref:DNA-binding NarL/FixJ family response regulator n=1 Tax=Agromyces flavus TaxID=589382 RepID=A0A1H1V736_9MICO|nr:response regulator [Agromyces flavus]MCP2365870.1 DNA-binding NarL/FixJ family response regulator [Agromyces flavus]GGI43543.1 DNA-binding response regulator [Agromyces flavus]SDS80614.1 DNA-binding response regulator, NarL/FixJ family, contains REC and HTH domains [Agromyces flavus]